MYMSCDMTKPTKWVCALPRLTAVWASVQSDQSLCCPHEESLDPYLPIKCAAKTLIRLGGCPGWSESSLGAQSLCWFCHVAAHIAPGHGHTTTWYKFWQQFKAFIVPIILYQFQKDPFCLIILYDILFYFIHVYITPGQEETNLGDKFFDGSRKVLSIWSLVACFQK